ncbi:MAG: FAD-dependent oxidoreductase [Hyphomicrobiales bacterium]|nr:FAD-dependent oxidoreductase [Hyphomicrobiales bacterium]MCP5372429.1 FAD-dependent oxidoreductase [Hyphomicrobiales bacterium]
MSGTREPDCDLAVIGGGPAGLAAAAAAAAQGLSTVLIDEQPVPGGQIYRNIEGISGGRPDLARILGDDYGYGAGLAQAFRASGATHMAETAVWELDGAGGLGVIGPEGARLMRARRVIVAVGAMERPAPRPGWTLPGVMALGACQTLLKQAGQVPDVPTVIVGSGPLVFLVAKQLVEAGAPPRAILETTPRSNMGRAVGALPGALGSLGDILKGLRWIGQIKRAGVVIEKGVEGVRFTGDGALARVEYRIGGAEKSRDAALALVHEGVVPNYQLAEAAGCQVVWDEVQLCWRTRADAWGATSQDAIAVAGDCVGIGGALAAEAAGRLAGLDAAHRLGRIDAAKRDSLAAEAHRTIARLAGVRRFLDLLYRPAEEVLAPPDDDTLLCRCEEVTAGEIRRVAGLGCPGPNQAKAFTRAGMGPCQGRMCGLAVSTVLARARGVPVAEVGHYRVRPPLKPVTVDQLADMAGIEAEVAALGGLPTGSDGDAEPALETEGGGTR